MLQGWLAWYEALLVDADTNAAWNVSRLEYAFATSAATPDGALTLAADEYADGRLDWYAMRGAAASLDAADATATGASPLQLRPLLPTPLQYAGKPADRYWEFEDTAINFGALAAGPTDLTRLLLAEFGLVYGNDWFVVPLRLPVGSITRVTRCLAPRHLRRGDRDHALANQRRRAVGIVRTHRQGAGPLRPRVRPDPTRATGCCSRQRWPRRSRAMPSNGWHCSATS